MTQLLPPSCCTYVVVDALGRCRATVHDAVVVAVINQQQAAGFNALFKVLNRLDLLALIAVIVQQVSEGVPQANDRVEAIADQVLDVVVQRQPVGLLNNCGVE